MPTYVEDGKTAVLFLFNHIIFRFGVPQAIVTDHGSHFQNQMMWELSAKLVFVGHSICKLIKANIQNVQYELSTQESIFIAKIIYTVYA